MNSDGVMSINVEELKTKKRSFSMIKKYIYLGIKRLFDIICSIIGCILLIPIAIIIKLCNIISGDFYPIIYSHERIGKNGKLFKLYKFRSMVPNADEVLMEMLKRKKWKEEWDKNQKFENDPRITKIGNVLRITSLDELPQLLNVLKGDMSLIGPRPLLKGELDTHNGNHKLYESVKPGLTGWWACNGRSATTYEERLKLEYYYCKNCSLLLDIKCIFKTINAVIFKKGAK